MLCVVQRVVDEELQLWDDAQLVADTCAQLVAHGLGVGVNVLQDFFGAFRREDAEVAACHAQVGADAHDADRHQHAVGGLCLPLEDVAQLFLQQARYFVLSGCFHKPLFYVGWAKVRKICVSRLILSG